MESDLPLGGCEFLILWLGLIYIYLQVAAPSPSSDYFNRRQEAVQHKRQLNRAQSKWQQIAHRTIAVEALYLGDLADRYHQIEALGVIGIQSQTLTFIPGDRPVPFTIPLSTIRWISHQAHTFQIKEPLAGSQRLTIHCELTDGWHVYGFSLPKAHDLAQQLQQLSHAHYATSFSILGPERVQRRFQNIYGHWSEDQLVLLYLTPDSLLCFWRPLFQLSQIQQLTLVPEKSDLSFLKVSYKTEFDGIKTIGFVMGSEQAQLWGKKLADGTGLVLDIQTGRKKKDVEAQEEEVEHRDDLTRSDKK